MKPVRIGLVGCGFTGAAKAICYRVLKGAELAAAATQKLPLADMASDFRD